VQQNLLPRLVDEYRALVDDLAASLASVKIDRARAEMRKLGGGEIQVNATADEIRLEAKQGVIDAALLRAAGQLDAVANSARGMFAMSSSDFIWSGGMPATSATPLEGLGGRLP
jgi:hypothetical protein